METKKFTVLDFKRKKSSGEKITMLTAYDYPMASLIDASGIDAILVGDSLGMVALGHDSTVRVTVDEMVHHAKAVKQGVKNSFLIGDMPFMSYQVRDEEAVVNAGRFIKEAGCDAVKLEGGSGSVSRVMAIDRAGIPVLGHIGLTPQSASKLGGYRVQGKDAQSAARLKKDAVMLEEAGCFALILECVPKELSREITKKVSIPTIGIGAGNHCDGQVMVTHDMLGFFDKFVPKFVKQYTDLNGIISKALSDFEREITGGTFPDDEHSF